MHKVVREGGAGSPKSTVGWPKATEGIHLPPSVAQMHSRSGDGIALTEEL